MAPNKPKFDHGLYWSRRFRSLFLQLHQGLGNESNVPNDFLLSISVLILVESHFPMGLKSDLAMHVIMLSG